MKLYNISLALMLGICTLTSCSEKLELTNPNRQTTSTFGNTIEELEECVIAAYNHSRIEGSYGRVGYTLDAVRGDEVWNSSQQWYLNYDDMNSTSDIPGNDNNLPAWIWREWYYTINVSNYILSKFGEDNGALTAQLQRIKGQALFFRALGYFNLAGYLQDVPLITDYTTYSSMDGLYGTNNTYDEVLDQVEKDFAEAMTLLPSREVGGEWALGRVTNGAAAGLYARTLMQRHKYDLALVVLKDIINGVYGHYELMANYGDNFREGAAYENNAESLYEVQFLDYGTQGTDDEWTPGNTSKNATQGHAVESNFAPAKFGGWADLSVSPWLYNLFKAERTTKGKLDPRLYWTVGSYESDWEGFENGNVMYQTRITAKDTIVTNEGKAGGIPVAKWTNMRTNICATVVTGLHGGINLRIMRYSDVLLRAAECENEVNGPTAQAIEWINQVRRRAQLPDLKLSDFTTADKLFEQIANVERPKEFGCEYGRGLDLIRWGFFYDAGRLQQLKEHGTFRRCPRNYDKPSANDGHDVYAPVSYSQIGIDSELKCSFDTYVPGHEFLPLTSWLTNSNPNLRGNSANKNSSNASYITEKGWKIHPVVDLSK